MRPSPPFAPRSGEAVDLLVVGALSIDRFPDGSTAAGGSAMHATWAAAALGARAAVVTVAGPEPAARRALADLSRMALVHAEHSAATLSYALNEVGGARRLTLAEPAPDLAAPPLGLRPRAVLYAPIANEFGADLAGQHYPDAIRVAILQGWLRTLERGGPVRPLPLASLPDPLVQQLRDFEALVASSEDLAAEQPMPGEQLERLRDRFGIGPLAVVTDGERGAWFDTGDGTGRVTPASVISGPSVGAGDAFAAALSLALADGWRGRGAVEQATAGAVAALRRRRG